MPFFISVFLVCAGILILFLLAVLLLPSVLNDCNIEHILRMGVNVSCPEESFGNPIYFIYLIIYSTTGPPLWSSGQSFWLQIQSSRVRFPALTDFLSSSGSGTGSTQPREVN